MDNVTRQRAAHPWESRRRSRHRARGAACGSLHPTGLHGRNPHRTARNQSVPHSLLWRVGGYLQRWLVVSQQVLCDARNEALGKRRVCLRVCSVTSPHKPTAGRNDLPCCLLWGDAAALFAGWVRRGSARCQGTFSARILLSKVWCFGQPCWLPPCRSCQSRQSQASLAPSSCHRVSTSLSHQVWPWQRGPAAAVVTSLKIWIKL